MVTTIQQSVRLVPGTAEGLYRLKAIRSAQYRALWSGGVKFYFCNCIYADKINFRGEAELGPSIYERQGHAYQ